MIPAGRPLRVLDLSGNDGWCAANLSLAGHKVDMIEMNEDAARRAELRRKDFPKMGRVVCGNLYDAPQHFRPGSYDAVVLFETIEHVPDIDRTLRTMERMVRPGGRCYLSTPEGAFERGRDPVMADWHVVESKGHLRACPAGEVATWGCARGIVHDFELEQRLACISWEPSPRKGKVVFYAGAGWDDPLPEKLLTTGMGGSETALVKMAELFARKGYDVRVYAGSGEGGLRSDSVTVGGLPDSHGQVLYAPHSAWDPGEPCDLFVASRIPEAFDRTIKAPRRVLWLHDADYADRITEQRVSRMTDVVVLSQFQRELLVGRYPHIAPKVFLSRNGIEPRLFNGDPPDKERLVAYTSSPDRGLDVLLAVWPEVRQRVPDARLEAAYSPVYTRMANMLPELGEFHRKVQRMLDQPGVTWRESLTQPQVADLYQRARVWAYASWHSLGDAAFPEISCISAMEAQAGGAIPVCLDHAALKETVVSGERIDGDPSTGEWRERFVDAIVRGLTDDGWLSECGLRGRTYAINLSWDDVAHVWEQTFLTSDEAYEARAAA